MNRAAAAQAALKAALPPDPRPGQGEQVSVNETITPVQLTAWVHPKKKPVTAKPKEPEARGVPLWWPPPENLLTRVYFAVGVNHGGRRGTQSNKVLVPLIDAPKPPGAITVRYDATALAVTWAPPGDARLPIQALPEPGMLPAKPIVEGGGVTTYNVYDAKALEAALAGGKKVVVPPLNPKPIPWAAYLDKRLVFGEERCYAVRAVLAWGNARLESPITAPVCVTPKDTFPPAAPHSLSAVGSEGGVSLIWEANSEPDLDGYLVLRGELKPDGTQPAQLTPITPAPINETTYRDNTAKPGVRYVYAVVAVDKATPPNRSGESNRVEESAR